MAGLTRIDSPQDLVRVLDEHPEWVDALRDRLLPRELLELPQQLAAFVAAADKRFAAEESRPGRLEEDRRVRPALRAGGDTGGPVPAESRGL